LTGSLTEIGYASLRITNFVVYIHTGTLHRPGLTGLLTSG